MREILFRGKHYKTGKWCYGIPFKDPVSGCEGAYYPQIIPEEHGTHQSIYRASVIEETIGQYTGLTDKNGVKISGTAKFTELVGNMRRRRIIDYEDHQTRSEA